MCIRDRHWGIFVRPSAGIARLPASDGFNTTRDAGFEQLAVIATDKFVLLNYPRTGSTFVRGCIRSVYGQAAQPHGQLLSMLGLAAHFRELILPIERTLTAQHEGRSSQHGTYSQIPARYQGLPVVSVARNPFDREVSLFEHEFWRKTPPGDPAEIAARFPDFPELSFAEFLQMQDEFGMRNVLKGVKLKANVGPETVHFIRFFHPDPDEALERMSDRSVDNGEVLGELPAIHFLHTESLIEDLCEFLAGVGISRDRIQSLQDREPVNAARRRAGRPWHEYFTPELKAEFRQRERLLFQRFPEYGEKA